MKKFVIFPNLIVKPEQKSNPYIQDFIRALNEEKDACVVNPSHKNPLLSILFPKNWGDIFVFNWFVFLISNMGYYKVLLLFSSSLC